MGEKGRGVLTRDAACLLSSTFLNTIPVGFINVVPLVYLAQIGYDPAVIGFIYSVSAIAVSVGLIPFGILADRYSRKPILVAGTLIPCVSYAIFGLTLNPAWLTIASVIGGVGFAGGLASALATPTLIPMLANSAPDSRRPSLFALLQGSWAVAFTVGSLLSLLPGVLKSSLGLSDAVAHSESYFVMSGLVVLSVVPLLFLKQRSEHNESREPDRNDGPSSETRSASHLGLAPGSPGRTGLSAAWTNIMKFSAVFLLLGLGLGVLVQLLPTWYALEYGASENSIGLWMAVSNLGTLLSIPLIPWILRTRGVMMTAAAGGVVAACLLALMSLTGSFETAAILFAVRSVAYGVSWATLQSYMMSTVDDSSRAKMVGFAYTAWGIGVFAGTFLGGDLLGLGLLALPFAAGVACYLASSVCLPVFFRKPGRGAGLSGFGRPLTDRPTAWGVLAGAGPDAKLPRGSQLDGGVRRSVRSRRHIH